MKLKSIYLYSVCLVLCSACKESDVSPSGSIMASANMNSSELLLRETYQKYATVSDREFFEKANPIIHQLKTHKMLANNKTDEPIELGDIFFYYEGSINAIHAQVLDPEDEIETVFSSFTVPIFSEEGIYYISISDYNDFYSEVLNEIQTSVSLSQNEYLVVADLNLTDLTSTTATINVTLSIGQSVAPITYVLTPGGEVHGANLAGWCGVSNSSGIDAADFVQGYLNGNGTAASLVCNTNQTRALILKGTWDLDDNPLNQSIFGTNASALGNYYWQDYTNSCVGDNSDPQNNEADWLSLFYNSTANNSTVESYFQTLNNDPNIHFMYSILQGVQAISSYPNHYANANGRTFFHTGTYYYGTVFCQ